MNTKELRELDAWIAINVMGYCRVEVKRGGHFTCHYKLIEFENGVECGGFRSMEKAMSFLDCHIPFYSQKSGPAMDALKKCAEKIEFSICKSSETYWIASRDETVEVHNTSLELAICLFAKQLFSKESK